MCVRVPLSELRVTVLLNESQVLTEKLSVNGVLSTLEHNLKEGGTGVGWTHLFGSISSPTGYTYRLQATPTGYTYRLQATPTGGHRTKAPHV